MANKLLASDQIVIISDPLELAGHVLFSFLFYIGSWPHSINHKDYSLTGSALRELIRDLFE
jgi:hypothetical protein